MGAKVHVQTIRDAFMHFCCMVSFPYEFYCNQCGYHLPIVVSDVNRKCAFSMEISKIEEIEESEENDMVNVEDFWGSIETEILACAFLKRGQEIL